MGWFSRAGLAAVAALMTGCNCGSDPTMVSVSIAPGDLSLERGGTALLTATATYSDSTTLDVTAQAQWSADDSRIVAVAAPDGGTCAVTGAGVGSTVVRASVPNGVSHLDAEVTVTVTGPPTDARLVVVPGPGGLVTTESGGTATFTVALSSRPADQVTVAVASNNVDEGTASPASLVFTPDNWNAPQTVTATGVDDALADGPQVYTVNLGPAVSGDPGFSGAIGSIELTNTDNDTAGVTVTPTSGLVTSESGGSDTFTVVLNSRPTDDVVIALTSSRPDEGTVTPQRLTFTAADWSAPRVVTVTGVDDTLADGSQGYRIVTAPCSSVDPRYAGLDVPDVSASNTDNDTEGFTLTPRDLTTTEAGGSATFTVVLNSRPTADVTVALSSSDTTEGTVAPASLTFTAANWSAPQTATVTGVDDLVQDGNQPYAIVVAAAVSADPGYRGIDPPDERVTNTDNDSAGITVSPTSGLTTTEAGGTATFTVVLNSMPTANVTVALSSSNVAEATVSPASLTFTLANWNAPQTVTVTGVADLVADGNQPFTIVTAAAVSPDSAYQGIDPPDVHATNTDNDSAGITVAPTSGLVTTEAGGSATFTVRLNSRPTANVTLALASSNTSEGTVAPASLTFTSANWNAPQTVTVTGVDDLVQDGNQPYGIVGAAAVSTDTTYAGLVPARVSVTNIDNDVAGITVAPTSGLSTTEAGGAATFTMVLNSRPTATVTLALASSRPTEGAVSPASLVFTPANWNAPQTVTATGVDDSVADGNQPWSVLTSAAVSTDPRYSGLNPPDVSLVNVDNDSAGLTVTPTSGLTTSEAGGIATFSVRLNSQPTANVTLALSSSNVAEGVVSPVSVTFTPANWAAPQIVVVTGVDDRVADGNQPYSVVTGAAVSTDPGYSGINPPDVSVINIDNDSAGFTVTPTSGLTTTEAGGAAIFSVRLNSQPIASVTIALSSSNVAEGVVSPLSVTFTTANWSSAQTVRVTGVDDRVADGNQPYSVTTAAAVSTDPGYSGLNPPDVSVTNIDNDSAGITVSPTAGLETSESGGTAAFSVVLNSQPTANVTILLTSSDLTEGTVSAATLIFTPVNWSAPQIVTVTGVDDNLADGAQPYTIVSPVAVSTDPGYSGLDPADVSVTNLDNDTAGFTVTPRNVTTTESGAQAFFSVALTTQPSAPVTVAVASANTGEATVSPASLTFTSLNWNAPQIVTVTGVDDAVADGAQVVAIVLSPATSGDAQYNGLNPADVTDTNIDNDSAGITVSRTAGLVTTEAGGTDTFTIVLNSQPTAAVTIALSSSRVGEGTVSPASVTFTTANWNAPQVVTARGVDDAVADGNQPYLIGTAPAVSADPGYNGMDAADVAVTNTDNDSAGITVTPTTGLVTTEVGGTATFTVVLNSQPTATVAIALSSSRVTEGTVSPASVTFTTANWNAPQVVTVTGVDDAIADGNQPYTVVTAAAVSTDPGYGGMNASDVSLTNTDNDSAGITVTPASGLVTTEAGGTATFTIVLNSQPLADVTIAVSSSRVSEGTVSPVSVTFTTANWSAPQGVTVTGVDDAVADGNQPYSVVTAPASSTDPGYSGRDAADVGVSNTDNDSAGITVTPTTGLVTTEPGGTAAFTIRLNSQPTADVTIAVSSGTPTEGTASPASLTFTSANWNAPQTVTVTGVDDAIADGNQPYTVLTSPAVSTDPGYSGRDAADVSLTNTDNDSAGITVTPTSGLVTTEAGGTATFTLVLNSQPLADVTIAVSSSRPAEGTVSPASVTFTPANWNTAQTVTATGVNDAIADGDQPYTILTAPGVSTDPGYAGRDAADVAASNTDNDSAGITVTPTTGLVTTEAGGTATFTVVLNSQPLADVTIALSSSTPAEGTVTPASLTFTSSSWNVAQTVTLTGVDDLVQDGNQPYTVLLAPAVSADPGYAGRDPTDVAASNTDNDTAGIAVTPTTGLVTSEDGGTATFTVVLNTQPTASVDVPLASSDTSEGTVSPAVLTFSPANWNVPQLVTATGVDDTLRDGNRPWTVVTGPATSADAHYNVDPPDVSLTNLDNDLPGISVTPVNGLITTELGGTATFTVVLLVAPTDTVTIDLATSDPTEGAPLTTQLVFGPADWNVPRTVTVQGIDDLIIDGDVPYTIITSPAVSTDPGYSGLDPADVSCTNLDNDLP